MEPWKHVWRKAIVPLAPLEGLIALRKAVADDDPRLLQGTTTRPPPLMAFQDWPCEASDALSFLFWMGDEGVTVGDTEEFFASTCANIDTVLGEPAACRMWLNWWDETPRHEMLEQLLPEIDLAICRKKDSGEVR